MRKKKEVSKMAKAMLERARGVVAEFNLGQGIKSLRVGSGLTLQDVQDATGLSKPLLSQIENDLVMPPLVTLARISEALGVELPFWFIQDNGPIAPTKKDKVVELVESAREALVKADVLLS